MPYPVKSLGYIKCCYLGSPKPIKTLAILADLNDSNSASGQEDLILYWKLERRPHFVR